MCSENKYVNIQTCVELDLNILCTLKDNAMLKHRPDLFIEWDFERNNKCIYTVAKGSAEKYWWICHKCNSSFDMAPLTRRNGSNCSYCSGKRVNNTNSLATLLPNLALEWHPTKNGALTPYNVTCGASNKIWWLCDKGHSYDATITNRNHNGRGCPYCSGQKVLVGFNDLWTTNPDTSKMLVNVEDGYKYSKGVSVKVDWNCPDCGEIVKKMSIHKVAYYGLRCPKCSDHRSSGEKLVYSLLNELSIDFLYDRKTEWSNNKRYDFYIPTLSLIIEVHGEQHYKDTKIGSRVFEEEQANDRHKYELAMNNGVKNYIVINARLSDFNFIKSNIVNSELINLLNLQSVNWDDIFLKSSKSFMLHVCELFNNGVVSSRELGRILNISRITVTKYLKQASSYGWIDYDPKKLSNMRIEFSKNKVCKKIVQLDLNGHLIKEWESISELRKVMKRSTASIKKYCENGEEWMGYKWMFKEAYINLLAIR